MKITVSSTSMMKPILHTKSASPSEKKHPQRIVGLLEPKQTQTFCQAAKVHARSNKSSANELPLLWQSFLRIPDRQSQLCVAVFGFEYDGDKTWYQLWSLETNQSYWLAHEDGMEYQPYSIMTMDALVSLLPEWDGELYLTLTTDNLFDATNTEINACENVTQNEIQKSNAANRGHELLISDAATTASGQLWFLVTVQEDQLQTDRQTWGGNLRTGWISLNNASVNAA